MNKNKLIKIMFKEIDLNHSEYEDCGEINCTKLAENIAEEYFLYEEYYNIPEYVFDAAVIAAERYENGELEQ